jgi:hypothetical protein
MAPKDLSLSAIDELTLRENVPLFEANGFDFAERPSGHLHLAVSFSSTFQQEHDVRCPRCARACVLLFYFCQSSRLRLAWARYIIVCAFLSNAKYVPAGWCIYLDSCACCRQAAPACVI